MRSTESPPGHRHRGRGRDRTPPVTQGHPHTRPAQKSEPQGGARHEGMCGEEVAPAVCRVVSCRVASRRVASCRFAWHRVVSCRVAWQQSKSTGGTPGPVGVTFVVWGPVVRSAPSLWRCGTGRGRATETHQLRAHGVPLPRCASRAAFVDTTFGSVLGSARHPPRG